MVRVPAGTYQMGSDEAAGPRETVHVAAFEIDVTEVTVGDYAVCVKSGACSASGTDVGSSCGYGHAGAEREPMTCVDWIQARDYCGSVGKRLPTEDEWEFAARGTDGRRYPWGNQYPSDQLCWKGAGNTKPATPGPPETYPRACDVGSYPSGASPFGALDMAGNVWEWTASPWCRPGSAKKVGCAEESRVMRGGTWGYTDPKLVRATERAGQAITDRSETFGFRCAR
jgi:formylglycine-generating enzyme required for sulfatase activity